MKRKQGNQYGPYNEVVLHDSGKPGCYTSKLPAVLQALFVKPGASAAIASLH